MTTTKIRWQSSSRKKRKKTSSLLYRQAQPATNSAPQSLPSKISRRLIRRHHTLNKQLSQALSANDAQGAATAAKALEAQGGIEAYQRASISGQSRDRGGDSSAVLVQWLRELEITKDDDDDQQIRRRRRLLEVGALRVDNEIIRSKIFGESTLIDLNPCQPGIKQYDFMEFPVPEISTTSSDDGRFDVISLSLVLNYVTTPKERGEMLKRTTLFLRDADQHEKVFPALFLVLPAPCLLNSRYLTEERLGDIMQSIGYSLLKRKMAPRLVYYLWRYSGVTARETRFKKEEVKAGSGRNNFAITM